MESFHDHFSDRAAAYAQCRPVYPLALARALGELCDRREACWDVGCGSGQMSALLASQFDRVLATDASAEQLAHVPALPNIEFRCEPAHRASLPDHSVDLIVAAQSAHWFDLRGFYREALRVGRSRAVLALVCYPRMTLGDELDRIVDPFYSGVLAAHWPPEREQVDAHYRTLYFPFPELAPSPALALVREMRASWTADEFLGYARTWSAVRSLERAGVHAEFEDFATRLRAAWGAPNERRAVVWPMAVRLTRLDMPR